MNKLPTIRLIVFLMTVALTSINFQSQAQSSFENFKKRLSEKFSKFKDETNKKYDDFRSSINEEFAKFLASVWEPFNTQPPEKAPEIPSPPPVVIDIDTVSPISPQPVIISHVIPLPTPGPQPEPVEPIKPVRDIIQTLDNPTITVQLYGTDFILDKPDLSGFCLPTTSGGDISNAWRYLNNTRTNNLINDCLKHREEKQLCDWGYLTLLNKVAENLADGNRNKATLLTGFLYSQSGYKMRLATDSNRELHLFYSPVGIVFGIPMLLIDGQRFYRLDKSSEDRDSYQICNFSFPGEQSLNFEIIRPMNLDYSPGKIRSVTAHNYPDVKMDVAVNKNLIDFYNDYPDATASQDPNSKWIIHANTPVSKEIRESVYPVIREAVRGKSQKEAANIILKIAQSFEYGYDNIIWGDDRAFFMDESWYYPQSDCEDHAINFTRIIRDIMGLEVALVYYPGHLAAAVAFTDSEITGDYIEYNGRRYIVCDPTIFYSNIGMTMRGMNNSEAVLIPLR